MSGDKKSLITGNAAHGHVAPKKRSLEVKVEKRTGPGQTRMNLTKDAVEEYKQTHKQTGAKPHEARPSLVTRFVGMFKRSGAR